MSNLSPILATVVKVGGFKVLQGVNDLRDLWTSFSNALSTKLEMEIFRSHFDRP